MGYMCTVQALPTELSKINYLIGIWAKQKKYIFLLIISIIIRNSNNNAVVTF
jgi:hypothetical protein